MAVSVRSPHAPHPVAPALSGRALTHVVRHRRRAVLAALISLGALAHAALAGGHACAPPTPDTFTVTFPKLVNPPDPHGWDLPLVWGPLNGQVGASDSIEVPNGRPIYALFVSGYSQNAHFDQLLMHDFATYLRSLGGYVHYAWWNNLLAPYMERPLHHAQSHPGYTTSSLDDFLTLSAAELKAMPGENYQFLADARLLLQAIRANNPEAIIVLAGHSMGGHSVAQLANESDVVIDLLAPIDPVASRTYPWASPAFGSEPHYNWTRYRATRESFNGYRSMTWSGGVFGECIPTGPWQRSWGDAAAGSTHPLCLGQVHVHGAPHMTLGSNVINLYHRWQEEAIYPFDFADVRLFNPNYPFPPGGSEIQLVVNTSAVGSEPGGWPILATANSSCCPGGNGVSWPLDGHGEIIGTRGPGPSFHALATRVRTSPNCGSNCEDTWPWRVLSDQGVWSNPFATQRVVLLKELESLPSSQMWPHRPYNSELCLVSGPLTARFATINAPAMAEAGASQEITCRGCGAMTVILDGSASIDPDDDSLQYQWSWAHGNASGATVAVEMPVGTHCVTLTVTDLVGHVSRDWTTITITDTSATIAPFTSAAPVWAQAAGTTNAFAFDEVFPGLPGASGCLLEKPGAPALIMLPDGSMTMSTEDGDVAVCAVTDAASTPAVADGVIPSPTAVTTCVFDPPITALYTFHGSLAIGHVATMRLFDADGLEVGSVSTPPSASSALAAGYGFTSTVPVRRVEFTATEPGPVILGAFAGLRPGEPSLGTVFLEGYGGPQGDLVQLDMAVVFASTCVADLSGDGIVDGGDLGILLASWGDSEGAPDLNRDGVIDGSDLGLILAAWGPCQ